MIPAPAVPVRNTNSAADVMHNFNEYQLKAIKHINGPALVVGTPGSGKTTVIINRIKNMIDHGIQPENILVITFNREAARSMELRFRNLECGGRSVRFSTFHSFFYWILKTAYDLDNSSVLTEKEERDILRRIISEVTKESEPGEEVLSSVISQIGLISADMIDINDYYSRDLAESHFRSVYNRYRDIKRKLGKIDFDDMLTEGTRLLREREDIREKISGLYRYILVDEFQDTSRVQYEALKLISAPQNNVFVVGDDDQSIYGFRGARPEVMFAFERDFKNAKIITLPVNYRCGRAIVKAADRLIRHNKKRFGKDLRAGNDNGEGSVMFYAPGDAAEENAYVIRNIRAAAKECSGYKDIAVLYRTGSQAARLIASLRDYNIPFDVRGGVQDIFSGFAVSNIIDYMHIAAGDMSRERFLRIMNRPVRYIKRDMLTAGNVDLNELLRHADGKDYLTRNIKKLANDIFALKGLSPYEAFGYIRNEMGYDRFLKKYTSERNMDLEEILDSLSDAAGIIRHLGSYQEVFEYIDDYRQALTENSSDGKDSVKLMTMHSAKGLEFKEVHIIGCCEGTIPHKKARGAFMLEEERRLFYVAVTRASEKVIIYAPKNLRGKPVEVSRFAYEMSKDINRL